MDTIPFAFPGVPSVQCFFTTRMAGNLSAPILSTDIVAARTRLMVQNGFNEWCEVYQVHGDDIWEAAPQPLDKNPECTGDGLFTNVAGRALFIKTADCQPILLTTKDARAVGAIHVGWRGNRLRFPETTVTEFCRQYSCSPQDVVAVRGPSLGTGVAEFIHFEKEWSEEFRPWFDASTKTMDLWGLTRYQLMVAGVPARQIYGLDLCTLSHPDMFFSYRRKDEERQMGCIWIAK